jgi:O-antigen ligase
MIISSKVPQVLRFCWRLFRVSFASLPYLSYASLVGLVAVIFILLGKFRSVAIDPLIRNGLLVLSGLMLLSCCLAFNRGEAFLQLANFFPFFLLFAVFPFLLNRVEQLERLAIATVIAAIPINLAAFGEYLLRVPSLPRYLRRMPLVHWIRSRPHTGRAMVMFDHPNALASYLVLVFGLGLGLILCRSVQRSAQLSTSSSSPSAKAASAKTDASQSRIVTLLLYLGTALNLVGLFSAGSRNGLLIAVSQLVLFSLFTKASRVVLIAGLAGLFAVVAGAVWVFGVGGRSLLTAADLSDDPRVAVWHFALGLIQQRPWLGWGLGNYKFKFPHGLIPGYDYIGHPHNFWLLLASEAGIPVMLLFTALVGYICFRAVRLLILGQLKPLDRAILLAYLFSFWSCIAFALFDVTFFDSRINTTNWVVLAGINAIASNRWISQVSEPIDGVNVS